LCNKGIEFIRNLIVNFASKNAIKAEDKIEVFISEDGYPTVKIKKKIPRLHIFNSAQKKMQMIIDEGSL
ncbi:MAG TPA: hypothetical protein VEK06_04510, partial [Myxococcota bacterium]|nr:hypothetical protein [Myxococcota bacterium]